MKKKVQAQFSMAYVLSKIEIRTNVSSLIAKNGIYILKTKTLHYLYIHVFQVLVSDISNVFDSY